jgi:hypothetical protein
LRELQAERKAAVAETKPLAKAATAKTSEADGFVYSTGEMPEEMRLSAAFQPVPHSTCVDLTGAIQPI